MKLLFNISNLVDAKSEDKFPCECEICGSHFLKKKREINKALRGIRAGKYCSSECRKKDLSKKHTLNCTNCNIKFEKSNGDFLKTKNHFCSKSCAATYNNTHKKAGTRRSKLESYLEQQLTSLYPNIEFHFNKKDAINSELDIYIPSLKLAFELNGIYHYEPIYGSDKLNQIQNNDQRKFQACIEQGISLCIIDTSKQKYFKKSTSQEFINIIIDIINNKSKN